MKLTTLALVCALAFTATIAPAFADEAADHLAKGTRFYNIQEWAKALNEYKQAYALDPRPDTLWAIAQTQRQAGDCRSAILSYKAYVRGASAAGANAAMEWIKSCEADLEAQRRAVDAATASPPPANVTTAPAAAPAAVAPPSPPKPAPARPKSWIKDPLGDTLLVVGVGALVTGGVMFTLGALDSRGAADEATSGAYDRAASSGRSTRRSGSRPAPAVRCSPRSRSGGSRA